MAGTRGISDIPDVILLSIISLVSDTRSRNSISLVSHKFMLIERSTRSSLTLRGNARHLLMIPSCFRSVTILDLSLISPWGHALLSGTMEDFLFVAHHLQQVFPRVTSLTVYARSPVTLQLLAPRWPDLRDVKLVRWHQRPAGPPGADFVYLFEHCANLCSLDLSSFYYWTEDLPPVLQAYPRVAARLVKLDLLTVSFTEGFKAHEIRAIVSACPNLREFLVACMFDPRYFGFLGDDALLAISSNCSKLERLHLVDSSSLGDARGDPDDDGFTSEDAGIGHAALVEFFSGLPLLEDLVLDVCRNVRDAGSALEVLNSKCPKLRALKLGQFHGICLAVESKLDGIALCQGLESLSIKSSGDLTDMGLIAIGRGCSRLVKFEIQGCKNVTVSGLRTMTCLLKTSLVDVKISCCKNLDARASLRALEPIRDGIQRLHIDCVWGSSFQDPDNGAEEEEAEAVVNFNLNDNEYFPAGIEVGESSRTKRCKYSSLDMLTSSYLQSNGNGNSFWYNSWYKLHYLSLWIGVGEVLTPLPMLGLEDCPSLEEIHIKVEGDCRGRHKPTELAFGLSCLVQYPQLSKMKLDCGDTIGFALTAPSGQMDLSLWERFFLSGIANLTLNELDYWPPQDRDVNQRSLSLPAAGLLAECSTLRKLFIHGTTHEHFLMFLLRIPNLRDVQLREDYYPAPEGDMSTEMRADSCCRFEDALNRRRNED